MNLRENERGYPLSVMRKIESDFERERQDWISKFDSYIGLLLTHGDSRNPRDIIRFASELVDERCALLMERYPDELLNRNE